MAQSMYPVIRVAHPSLPSVEAIAQGKAKTGFLQALKEELGTDVPKHE